jgi:hypothetical protein
MLLVACGGSSHAATVALVSATDTVSTANTASASLTKQQAQALAHAVNLRPGDLQGFKASHAAEHATAAEKQREQALLRCVRAPKPAKTVFEASSPMFERESSSSTESASSTVTVLPSSAAARNELKSVRGSRAPGCIAGALDKLFVANPPAGATVRPVSVAVLSMPAAGSEGSFGWRISIPLEAHGLKLVLTSDLIGFAYGPAEVVLFTSGSPALFPASVERHLFALLLSRAKSQH